jgi:predicted N-acetyltransferase YhbS
MTAGFDIVAEGGEHEFAREALLDRVIGPIRFRRACERLREGRLPAPGLGFVAIAGGAVAGTVRLWPVRAPGLQGALLLGPLAVEGEAQGRGIGGELITHALDEAAALGHRAVVLVGDAPYYARFGFAAEPAHRLAVPGPFERHRLLGRALAPGAFEGAAGILRPAGARAGDKAPATLVRVA